MEVEDFREKLVTKASMLSNSPRIRDAESGAILHEFIFIRWVARLSKKDLQKEIKMGWISLHWNLQSDWAAQEKNGYEF